MQNSYPGIAGRRQCALSTPAEQLAGRLVTSLSTATARAASAASRRTSSRRCQQSWTAQYISGTSYSRQGRTSHVCEAPDLLLEPSHELHLMLRERDSFLHARPLSVAARCSASESWLAALG